MVEADSQQQNIQWQERILSESNAFHRFRQAYNLTKKSQFQPLTSYEPGRYLAPKRRFASPYMVNSSYLNPSDPNSMRNLGILRHDPFSNISDQTFYTPTNTNSSFYDTKKSSSQSTTKASKLRNQFYDNLNLAYAFGGKTSIQKALLQNKKYNHQDNSQAQDSSQIADQSTSQQYKSDTIRIKTSSKQSRLENKSQQENQLQENKSINIQVKKMNKASSKRVKDAKKPNLEKQKQMFQQIQKEEQKSVIGVQEILQMIDNTRKNNSNIDKEESQGVPQSSQSQRKHKKSLSINTKESLQKFREISKGKISDKHNESQVKKINSSFSDYSKKTKRPTSSKIYRNIENLSTSPIEFDQKKSRPVSAQLSQLRSSNIKTPLKTQNKVNLKLKKEIEKLQDLASPSRNSLTVDQMLFIKSKSRESTVCQRSQTNATQKSKRTEETSSIVSKHSERKRIEAILQLISKIDKNDDSKSQLEKINEIINQTLEKNKGESSLTQIQS